MQPSAPVGNIAEQTKILCLLGNQPLRTLEAHFDRTQLLMDRSTQNSTALACVIITSCHILVSTLRVIIYLVIVTCDVFHDRKSVPVHCWSNHRWRSTQGESSRLRTRPWTSQQTQSVGFSVSLLLSCVSCQHLCCQRFSASIHIRFQKV